MGRHFVKEGFCWRGEIRRFLGLFGLLLRVGWKMFAWNSLCECVYMCLFIWGIVCMCRFIGPPVKWNEDLFFLLTKPQQITGELSFLPSTPSWTLFFVSPVTLCMIFGNCCPPLRREYDNINCSSRHMWWQWEWSLDWSQDAAHTRWKEGSGLDFQACKFMF